MEIIIGFFIFCLVLFIYLHVQFHLKTSEDLEMYEVDQPSKDKLEEMIRGNKCLALRHAWTLSETCISIESDFR